MEVLLVSVVESSATKENYDPNLTAVSFSPETLPKPRAPTMRSIRLLFPISTWAIVEIEIVQSDGWRLPPSVRGNFTYRLLES